MWGRCAHGIPPRMAPFSPLKSSLAKATTQWRICQPLEKQLPLAEEVWGPLSDPRGVSFLLSPSIQSPESLLFAALTSTNLIFHLDHSL